jgi:hypothetical protein
MKSLGVLLVSALFSASALTVAPMDGNALTASENDPVVVTRTTPGLPRGCRPREAAQVLQTMFAAFSTGDRQRFERSFFRPGARGERFRWFAIYDGVSDVTLTTRAQLLGWFAARIGHGDTLRLRRIDIGVDTARGIAHFGYFGVRRADDLPPGRGGAAGIVEGKGAYNCRARTIIVFTAGMTLAPGRLYPHPLTGRGPCPLPTAWDPVEGPVVACTRGRR